jgi:lipid-A-disaccharide synthase
MKIALIAGEASGDVLAADLMQALKQQHPGVEFIGMGGPNMAAQGLLSWFDYSALSIMGLVEVLKHLPKLLKLRKQLLKKIIAAQPDIVIGIDAPDFNLGLEKSCKKAGLRTVHFISPSIWAWRQNRAQHMAKCADLILCLFPMEPPIYQRFGVNAEFIGHPLADRIALQPDVQAARAELQLTAQPCLALLPGSRLSEINTLLPIFLHATQLLSAQIGPIQVLIPAANPACKRHIQMHLDTHRISNARIFDGQAQSLMMASDAVLLASGTAALEAMLCKKPMVIAYKISKLTYFIVHFFGLMKVTHYSLPNALAGYELVPELMQDRCRSDLIAETLRPLLQKTADISAMNTVYLSIHQQLKQQAAQQAAAAITRLLANPKSC